MKFLIDLADDARTYFIDSKKWELHFYFVRQFLDTRALIGPFHVQEYTRSDRRFVLGSVMHYLDGDHWTIELAGGDTLEPQRVAWMFNHVRARMHLPINLLFRPVSPSQIENAKSLGGRIPVLSSDLLNASIAYQPVVLGTAFGYLRLFPGAIDVASVRPNDVVVGNQVPEQIPPVAALITGQLQAPLAHVAVLSRNRNTPDMALRGVLELPAIRALEGRLVKLTVASQDYGIEAATVSDAEAAWASIRPAVSFRPECDLLTTGLHEAASLAADAERYVGAKAAQMGRLCQIEGISTPQGFVLPFSAYAAHLDAAGLTSEIGAMLDNPDFRSDGAVRQEQLARLRSAITTHPVEPNLLVALHEKLHASLLGKPAILRSSTNAEDLEGFNGAGLYESTVIPADPTPNQIADALRSVWASVWLQRAFEERDWFRIDHRSVAMAVLIQPFVDEAVATGVAITGNPFRQVAAVFINTQVSGATVTGALGNEIPEQYLVATWGAVYEPELLSHSSLTRGAPILSGTELRELTSQLLCIHTSMLSTRVGEANAMDVEFALTAQRRFVILQARPYTIVYSLDRSRLPERKAGLLERVVRRVHRIALQSRLARRTRASDLRVVSSVQGSA
ncbi:MAG: PEP/pyruvate-binding domain-containing protein [Burkholderiaceae bacterium]